MDWSRPGAVAFADGTAAHLACYEQADATGTMRPGAVHP